VPPPRASHRGFRLHPNSVGKAGQPRPRMAKQVSHCAIIQVVTKWVPCFMPGLGEEAVSAAPSFSQPTELDLREFADLSLNLLCIAGTDGYFKYLNPAWETTFGYSRQELLSRPYVEFVHPHDRQATVSEAAHVASGRSTLSFENRYRCKDGSYRWLLSTLSRAFSLRRRIWRSLLRTCCRQFAKVSAGRLVQFGE
jgi:PAS domain S-box-containing protein